MHSNYHLKSLKWHQKESIAQLASCLGNHITTLQLSPTFPAQHCLTDQFGMGFPMTLWKCDTCFNFCKAEARLMALGHNSLRAPYHNLCWTIMGGSIETKHTYKQSDEAVQPPAHSIFKLPVCCLEDCIKCTALCWSWWHAKISVFLSFKKVIQNQVLPANRANWDCGCIMCFHILRVST